MEEDGSIRRAVEKLAESMKALVHAGDDQFPARAAELGRAWVAMPWPDDDDPVNDFSRLVAMVTAHAATLGIQYTKPGKPDMSTKFVDRLASQASQMLPGYWTADRWRRVIRACLGSRYGGSRVRIKKLPARQKREDSKILTVKQMMEKHGISKSYAYKLLTKKKK